MPASAEAVTLPSASAPRGTGLTSSASSDPRSRSPAVASVASCIAPVNAASSTINGITDSSLAARCCVVDTSTPSTFSGVAAAGLTPRPINRSAPISALYCCSRPLHALHLRPRVRARAVGHHLDARGARRAEVVGVVGRHHQHDVFRLFAHGLLGVGRCRWPRPPPTAATATAPAPARSGRRRWEPARRRLPSAGRRCGSS